MVLYITNDDAVSQQTVSKDENNITSFITTKQTPNMALCYKGTRKK